MMIVVLAALVAIFVPVFLHEAAEQRKALAELRERDRELRELAHLPKED